jgi:DNA end-binding protein Ku
MRPLAPAAPTHHNGGMPRSIWSGAISFGLVNVPIKLYSAVSRKTVRFHQLNERTGNRIQQKRVDPSTGEEVAYDDIVKGYELTKDSYVVIRPDELEALDPEKSRTIDIEDFVDLADIDPVYYDHPYYLVPDKGAGKAYGLLLGAMKESGKVAIARVVLRSKEQLVAIRPAGDVLMMETMIFHDEVVPPDEIEDLPDAQDLKASDRELKMAQQLIDSLSSEFEPDRYHDEYREKVLAMVERKAQGEEIAVQAEAPEPTKVPDLMAALEASLAAVRDQDATGNGAAEAEAEDAGAEDGKAGGKARRSKSSSSHSKGGGSRSKSAAKK